MSDEKEQREEEEQMDLQSTDGADDAGDDQNEEGEEGDHTNDDDQGNESVPKKRLTKSEKKLLARQKHREMLHAAKARKKQQKKEQKQQLRAEKGDTSSDRPPRTAEDIEEQRAINEERRIRKQKELQTFLQGCNNNFEIILDCAWENEHNYQTLSSLVQQIVFCYGANKKAKHPCGVRLFGMGPETKTRLDKLHCPNWKGFHAYEEDFTAHIDDWYSRDPVVVDSVSSEAAAASSVSQEDETLDDNIPAIPTKKRQIVYLTSDAEETLETLDPNCAYVIGGIVDRNRLKGITYQKACTHKLRAAKLPIKEWFSLAATHVLTVNHVFEIMLNFQATQSWTDAMNAVLPKRKEAKLIGSSEGNSDDEEQDNDEADRADQPSDAKRPRLSGHAIAAAVAVEDQSVEPEQRDS